MCAFHFISNLISSFISPLNSSKNFYPFLPLPVDDNNSELFFKTYQYMSAKVMMMMMMISLLPCLFNLSVTAESI